MKQTLKLLFTVLSALVAILSVVSCGNIGSAQESIFSIDKVNHHVEVMYSGHMLVVDTVHVSGSVPKSFLIGLPLQYSVNVLKVFAYDNSQTYAVHMGVPLGDRGGFYACEIDLEEKRPDVFTVVFVLSNSRVEEIGAGNFTLDFPAYPSLTQTVGTCNVSISFPSTPASVSVTRDGQDVGNLNYLVNDLAAYTYSVGHASVKVPMGAIQLMTIEGLQRQVNIDATGAIRIEETYELVSRSNSPTSALVFSLPSEASNIVVKDVFGDELVHGQSLSQKNNIMLVNATLRAFVDSGQTTTMTVQYNLPDAKPSGGQYTLTDFDFFPDCQYVIDHATVTFNLPEGATIVAPVVSELEPNSTLTRQTFQDTLTVTQNSISYVENLTPQRTNLHLVFDYNPVWVSFRPTFWAALIGTVTCAGALAYRKIRPSEQTYQVRSQQLAAQPLQSVAPETVKVGQPIKLDALKAFFEAYESKRLAILELRALDMQAQKGKIQRHQYKIQRNAVETRLTGLTVTIDRWKPLFLAAGGSHADMVRQLDLAETDLAKAEENIKVLESRQRKGEISLEAYKHNAADSQRVRDKADSAINGILSRLREKIRRAT